MTVGSGGAGGDCCCQVAALLLLLRGGGSGVWLAGGVCCLDGPACGGGGLTLHRLGAAESRGLAALQGEGCDVACRRLAVLGGCTAGASRQEGVSWRQTDPCIRSENACDGSRRLETRVGCKAESKAACLPLMEASEARVAGVSANRILVCVCRAMRVRRWAGSSVGARDLGGGARVFAGLPR